MQNKQFTYFIKSNNKPNNSILASSGAVLKNKAGEYLFEIKPETHSRNPGGLALFGGIREKDESEKSCLKRELLEELQFNVDDQGCKLKHLGYAESTYGKNIYHARYLIEDVDDSDFILSNESAGIFKIKDLSKIAESGISIQPGGVGYIINVLTNIENNKELLNKWNRVKGDLSYYSLKLFREREIWWTRYGQNVGYEQDGKGDNFMRPVLILQKHNWHTALVLPMTSKDKSKSKFHIPVKYNKKVYYVSLSQAKVISSKRLVRRIRKINNNVFQKILNEFINQIKTHRT